MLEKFDALVVFAKVPRAGRTKTRLGREIGQANAARLYGHFLRYLSWRLKDLPENVRVFVAAAPGTPLRSLKPYFPHNPGWTFFTQKGKDLGQRMVRATEHVRALGARKTVLVGSDCLHLSPAHISKALRSLERADLALGPARDGGFYLLGWKKPRIGYFRGVSWSSPSVLERTVRNTRTGGAGTALLPLSSDIDTKEDLGRSARSLDPRNPWTRLLLMGIKTAFRVKIRPV